MSDLKTTVNDADVEEFLNAVPDERRRRDSFAILEMMKDVTGEEPKMWGPSIVGFGTYHYKYASGREGDMPVAAFSPRKQNLTVYIPYTLGGYEEMRGRLGKHKISKACLYINKLDDVNQDVLREIVERSVEHVEATDPYTERLASHRS